MHEIRHVPRLAGLGLKKVSVKQELLLLEPLQYHLAAVQPWVNHLASLGCVSVPPL